MKKIVRCVSMSKEMIDELERVARAGDCSVSSVVRAAVRDYLEMGGGGDIEVSGKTIKVSGGQ